MYRLLIRKILRKGKKGKQKNTGKVLVRSIHTRINISCRATISLNSKAFNGKKLIFLKTNKRSFSTYSIHPAIGVARLGNSLGYYDGPTTIGGLPTNPITKKDVTKFRDDTINKGLLRQASVFNIYDESGNKIDLKKEGIKEIVWSAWLANKKAGFYNFSELQGNPLLTPYWMEPGHTASNSNSYEALGTPKRNPQVSDENRQKLIIDFGPRECSTADGPEKRIQKFDVESVGDYQFASYPSKFVDHTKRGINIPWKGNATDITSLGHMHVSEDGQLRIIPGSGASIGKTDLSSFAGGDLWWDDISDGPVQAVIKFEDTTKEDITLTAWCLVGSPKYAPELVNISTFDDVTYDAAVRYNSEFRNPVMVNEDLKFNLGETGFKPIYSRDIKPIFDRMKNYNWVSNVDAMVAFANPPFNLATSDPNIIASEMDERKKWFSLLRKAFPLEDKRVVYPLSETDASSQALFSDQNAEGGNADIHFPLMPLNSGDNSVTAGPKEIISKFATVTPVQYYFLYQWTHGFVNPEGSEQDPQSLLCNPNFKINALDQAATGNCVGYPASPGIETTWNIRIPWIYQPNDPYRILPEANLFEKLYKTGLSPLRDENVIPTEIQISEQQNPKTLKIADTKTTKIEMVGTGLQPGDLTKRMAIPWQADFSECSWQPINFTNPDTVNPLPVYFSYWWPPQAPWNVYLGYEERSQQVDQDFNDPNANQFEGLASGKKVYYQRGIQDIENSKQIYDKMIKNWQNLGFIVNSSKDKNYPYFVETERNYLAFNDESGNTSTSSDNDDNDTSSTSDNNDNDDSDSGSGKS